MTTLSAFRTHTDTTAETTGTPTAENPTAENPTTETPAAGPAETAPEPTAPDRKRSHADGMAVASFILGLLGTLVLNVLLGPCALVLGALALARGTHPPRPRPPGHHPRRRRPDHPRHPRHHGRHHQLAPGRLTQPCPLGG